MRTKVVDCGRPSSKSNALWQPSCGAPQFCYDTVTDPKKKTPEDAYATFVQANGRWVLQSVWCPATAQPIPTTQALREQVLRLLPSVQIGSAWTHRALVNAETILWADTGASRTLRTVNVVGRRVHLRIAFDHANWNFGDQHTDTTTDPGKPYSKTDRVRHGPMPRLLRPHLHRRRTGHDHAVRRLARRIQPRQRRHLDRRRRRPAHGPANHARPRRGAGARHPRRRPRRPLSASLRHLIGGTAEPGKNIFEILFAECSATPDIVVPMF